jgi:hypothetical protein
MKHYSPTGRRNYGRPLKRLLDTWDRNGSTSGPTPWKIDDDDDDEIQYITNHKTQYVISTNPYMFQHVSAIRRESTNSKDHRCNTPLQVLITITGIFKILKF